MANQWKNMTIDKDEIKEVMVLVKGSNTDYITPTGIIYKDYGNNKFYKKANRVNKYNGYVYCNITFSDNKDRNRRVHKLIAEAYILNPNPEELLIVGHKDNNKQNNNINNLYWTTNQENIQKAVDDGLLVNASGINNESSQPIKVSDIKTNKVIAVYGSISEAERLVKNLSRTYLAKILKRNGNYKPRGKIFKYAPITKEDYLKFPNEIKHVNLIENSIDKSPKIFKAINVLTGEEVISDNQTQFAKDYGLEQASISQAIKENYIHNNWKFEFIEATTYLKSSAYSTMVNNLNDVVIKNIYTNEIKTFKTKKELRDYFGLNGHDILQYKNNKQLILSKWEVISA